MKHLSLNGTFQELSHFVMCLARLARLDKNWKFNTIWSVVQRQFGTDCFEKGFEISYQGGVICSRS